MSDMPTFEGTEEEWDSRQLGAEKKFAAIAPDDIGLQTSDSLGLQPISIRLEKSLIDDFKLIASIHGIGYQPLMRQILKRFANAELKQLLREATINSEKIRRESEKSPPKQEKTKKVA